MYLWVILATFIVALASFNLSVRPDMRQLYVEPQAEAAVTRIMLQHQGAAKYVESLRITEENPSAPGFSQGEISPDKFQDYLPAGFEVDYEGNVPVTEKNITAMYCMDKEKEDLSTPIGNCNDSNAMNYLVTYGCVPQRWKSLRGGRPSNDLINAINTLAGRGSNFGYTIDVDENDEGNTLHSTMAIFNMGRNVVYLPQFVVSGDIGETGFSNVCGANRECDYCLVYFSTYSVR